MKFLSLAPSVLDATVLRMPISLMARLSNFEPAICATIYRTQSVNFSLLERSASVIALAKVHIVAAAGDWSSLPIEGSVTWDAGYCADVPDFEVVVPDGAF
jgi:hypothetical protein